MAYLSIIWKEVKLKVYPPTTHMTFSCTTALWEARPSDVPKGLTLGKTQKDSVEGTVSEQSGPVGTQKEGMHTTLQLKENAKNKHR